MLVRRCKAEGVRHSRRAVMCVSWPLQGCRLATLAAFLAHCLPSNHLEATVPAAM